MRLIVKLLIMHHGNVGIDIIKSKLIFSLQRQTAPDIMRHFQAVICIEIVIGLQIVKDSKVFNQWLFSPIHTIGIFLQQKFGRESRTATEIVSGLFSVLTRQRKNRKGYRIDIIGMSQELSHGRTTHPETTCLLRQGPSVNLCAIETGLAGTWTTIFS